MFLLVYYINSKLLIYIIYKIKMNKKHKISKEKPFISDSDSDDNLIIKNKPSETNKSANIIHNIKKEIPMESAIEQHREEYMKNWKFNPMKKIAKAKIDGTNGSSIRMNNITSLKYTFHLNSMNTIVIVMKIYDYNLKKEANYATLFCEMVDDIPPIRLNLVSYTVGKLAFHFYSACPSHISADGEYRSSFSPFFSLNLAKKNYHSLWMELEDYIYKKINKRNWSIYSNFFYPEINQKKDTMNIEFTIKNEMISNTLLIISWFHTVFEEYIGLTKSHVNKNYQEIFLNYKEEDIKFIETLIKKFGIEMLEKFKAAVTHTTLRFYKENNYMQCGYKMIPLNIKEVQDPLKIRYKPWREYFISARLNDLIINSISPNFPIINDWFYIKNSNKGLYDNKSQYDKMKQSDLAKEILKLLYEAQRSTYFAAEDSEHMVKTSKDIKKWINQKFKKLNQKISDPINYSIEEIIMSDVTLAFSSEFVGRTFADSINLIKTNKQLDALLGYPLSVKGYDIFAKYIFDICYGLLAANKRLGLIHGDLHLNNATIGPLYYLDKKNTINKDKTNNVVYVINDEFQYVFPNNGYFASVIDFSRGIINPDDIELYRDLSLPRTQKIIDDDDKFRVNESNNLLNLYIQLFPNKSRQREELVVLFKNNFEAVFKLLTCIDIYMFTTRLMRMLSKDDIVVNKKAMNLLDKINRLSEGYIATDMNHLFNETESYNQQILDAEFPIQTIIKKCFSDYNDGMIYSKIDTISDVYILDNQMKYSLDCYSKFPDFMKNVKYIENNTVKTVKAISEKRKNNRIEYETQKNKNLDIVNYIAKKTLTTENEILDVDKFHLED